MQINGISHVHGAQPVNQPHRAASVEQTTASRFQTTDQVDISPEANYVSQVHDAPDIRQDRVAAIRAAIADGVYETPDKMDIALERLLDEIA